MTSYATEGQLSGDQRIQAAVLESLAEAVNHRRWFAGFAVPYLGEHPIEIGSGLGDYAAEWLPHVRRFTATEADPDRLIELKSRYADDVRVEARQMLLPTDERGDHTALVSYNVLEHIEDDVEALRSMARLVRPGAPLVLVVPAFPIAMSRVDVATGHWRRYTRRTLTEVALAAGLSVEHTRYVNSLGFICYFLTARVLGMAPQGGAMMRVYDSVVTPVTRALEARLRPPFGQSVLAVLRRPH
ncbi:class I SAM-dependent methyltransferase [Catellatospora sp. KI3]|uniref:class I SAM-dependent methyltransferase n=1 Tax=Catellatospora sp. KI3 TaxID=3041620 RepID=UPI00248328D3|nr:class I SAM-dependent methyltransferase [Catellatospora sp. KI3]MDI1459948.1 class I SAM-dependent methyltransferase [Catellatospora sp. KI3]